MGDIVNYLQVDIGVGIGLVRAWVRSRDRGSGRGWVRSRDMALNPKNRQGDMGSFTP